MLKKILIGAAVVLAVFIVASVIFYFAVVRPSFKEAETVRNMKINDIDLNKVADGIYAGDYTYGKFTCEVEVAVKNNTIENIKVLKNCNTKYAEMAEGVIEKIMHAQSTQVDAITGATTTSKALMKAVENALNKGAQK
jgi:uncharacterized protein with FMN-binding domain